MFCQICQQNYISLASHIVQKHEMTAKAYYDEFIRKENEGVCYCGKEVTFTSIPRGYLTYCSLKCKSNAPEVKLKAYKSQKAHYDDPNLKEESLQKRRAKWSLKTPEELEEIAAKKTATRLELHNGQYYDVEKFKDTISKRTDEDRKEITLKRRQTKEMLYGDAGYNNSEQARETILKVWGTDNYNNRKQYIETMQREYGLINSFQMEKCIANRQLPEVKAIIADKISLSWQDPISRQQRISKIVSNANDKTIIRMTDLGNQLGFDIVNVLGHENYVLKCRKCNQVYEMCIETFRMRVDEKVEICSFCNPYHQNCSRPQKALEAFIRANSDYTIISNSKMIIKPLELDIYIPELKFAIEFNGAYWHGSEKLTDKFYHTRKSMACFDLGISLLHIHETDYYEKEEIINKLILKKLQPKPLTKVQQVHIPEQELIDFLLENTPRFDPNFDDYLCLGTNSILCAILFYGDYSAIIEHLDYEIDIKSVGLVKLDNDEFLIDKVKKYGLEIIGYEFPQIIDERNEVVNSGSSICYS